MAEIYHVLSNSLILQKIGEENKPFLDNTLKHQNVSPHLLSPLKNHPPPQAREFFFVTFDFGPFLPSIKGGGHLRGYAAQLKVAVGSSEYLYQT